MGLMFQQNKRYTTEKVYDSKDYGGYLSMESKKREVYKS